MNNVDIGNRLKERRKELGATIIQVHDQTGISTGILSAWERGEKLPSAPSLMKLSDTLKCSVDWILFGENSSSLKSENILLSSADRLLLDCFHQLTTESQQEILDLIDFKLIRQKRKEKSSPSATDTGIETA